MIDREIFFDAVRDELFGGAMQQVQVDGMSVILAVWEYQGGGTPMTDDRWLAYMLATTYHETATRMWPIREYGSENYLKSKPYYPYFGRGFVQLTWEENYRNAWHRALSDRRAGSGRAPRHGPRQPDRDAGPLQGNGRGVVHGSEARGVLQRRDGRSAQRPADHQRQ